MPKYPNIKIKLVGCDGNAFAILGRCFAAMRNNNMPESEQDKFKKQAHLVTMQTFYQPAQNGLMQNKFLSKKILAKSNK